MLFTVNMMKTHKSFASMYEAMLSDTLIEPEYEVSPRGYAVRERTNVRYSCSNPLSNLFKNEARSIPAKYLAGELLWYFTGDNTLETISKYSGFWSDIANTDGTLNSAYGHLLFNKHNGLPYTQWQWAYDSLVSDSMSRQAIMYFGRPDFQIEGTKDFVCTTYGMFMIRNNKLNFHLYMRSNDVIKGTTFDIPFFMLLQQQMHKLLLSTYPTLQLGTYYHNVSSLHIYERDFDVATRMLVGNFEECRLPTINHDLVDITGECLIKNAVNDPLINWLNNNS